MLAPTISVIIPIYNTEEYLDRCLKSLQSQTWKDFEVIMINDGSNDESFVKMHHWSQRDARFKGFDKGNGGLSSARNYGIQKSRGKYIAFVDSDDWVNSQFLESLMKTIDKYNADIVFCNLQKVNEKGSVLQKLNQIGPDEKNPISPDNFHYFGELSWFACNKIFKKELLTDDTFKEGIHFEDIASVPSLFLKAQSIASNPNYLYQYFERDGSITRSFNEKGLDMFKAIDFVKQDYEVSTHASDIKEWKRFFILQGVFSYLAYVARVKNISLRNRMYAELKKQLKIERISKKEILRYRRFHKNYILSVSPLKMIYYMFAILFKL